MLYRVDTTPPAPAESYGPHLTPFLRVKEPSRSTREENPRGDRCPEVRRGSHHFQVRAASFTKQLPHHTWCTIFFSGRVVLSLVP